MDNKKGSLSDNISDSLTVLVFKDNFAARTFRVPLKWVNQIGIWMGVLAVVALMGGFLAVKYYRASRAASPARVHELEQELGDLKASLASQHKQALPEAPSAPDKTVQPQESPVTSQTGSFAYMPAVQMADPASVPILLQNLKLTWQGQGKVLGVNFAILYQRDDGGHQQGKILILARGADSFLVYPSGVFNPLGSSYLLAPEKGEFFSVSRYREVKARFGPVTSYDSIRDIEIFLLDDAGRVLVYQSMKAPAAPASGSRSSSPSPAPSEPPVTGGGAG